ncbi:MAG: tRNA pseudouridine(38-40) synthase TruA [Planctomycetota bacterium]|nr:tRNA pseudouridine(38-40) synthase TruA [Planctomycetota bacterium]
MPTRIKLTLEYDGTDFHGWQVQDRADGGGVRTIQGEIERALRKLTGQPVRIAGAGRTDEGVHALGQVATFDLPDGCNVAAEGLAQGLNAHLPPDVAALKAEAMPPDFHAMASSAGKIYRYQILNRRTRPAVARRMHWHVRFELDVDKMRAAAAHFVGTHDYTAFATTLADIQAKRAEEGKTELETVRTIHRVEVTARGSYGGASGAEIFVEVEGSGFLYKMVRTMVGSLAEVGRGKEEPDWIARVLASKDRRLAGPTAPAKGLFLVEALFH